MKIIQDYCFNFFVHGIYHGIYCFVLLARPSCFMLWCSEVPTNAGIVYGSSFRRRARPSAVEFETIHGMIRRSGFEKRRFATTKPQEWDRDGIFLIFMRNIK